MANYAVSWRLFQKRPRWWFFSTFDLYSLPFVHVIYHKKLFKKIISGTWLRTALSVNPMTPCRKLLEANGWRNQDLWLLLTVINKTSQHSLGCSKIHSILPWSCLFKSVHRGYCICSSDKKINNNYHFKTNIWFWWEVLEIFYNLPSFSCHYPIHELRSKNKMVHECVEKNYDICH